jgi:hypothetical protein
MVEVRVDNDLVIDYFNDEDEGKIVNGKIKSKEIVEGLYGEQQLIKYINNKGELHGFYCSSVLERNMKKFEAGDKFKIEFIGFKVNSAKTRSYKDFKVYKLID